MKYYTGVGSRETPKAIMKIMEDVAFKLSQDNWILRSGGADGSDKAFEAGARNSLSSIKPEIYLPWHGYNYLYNDPDYLYPKDWDNFTDAEKIASEIHPAWDKCSNGAKLLHSRNIYQVLGKDLRTPSKFLVCYAKPTSSGRVSGGTNTAFSLAKRENIKCLNLYLEEDIRRLEKYLEKS